MELDRLTPVDELRWADETEQRIRLGLRRCWLPVAYADSVRDRPIPVLLLGERLVVTRFKQGVRAFRDLCPHRGTQLSLGSMVNDCLRCAYHGWTFNNDGVCVEIPADPTQRIPSRAKLQNLYCIEGSGMIWVCLDGDPLFPAPGFPERLDSSVHKYVLNPYDWECGSLRRIENFMDLAHIPWVHEGVLGTPSESLVPDHQVERNGSALEMRASFMETANMKVSYFPGGEGQSEFLTHHHWLVYMPVTILWRQSLPGDRRFGLFLAVSPLTERRCRTFCIMFRDFAQDKDADFDAMQMEIAEADRVIAESQHPLELPFDITSELHVRGPDRFSIEYRRWISEIGELAAAQMAASGANVQT